MDEKQEKTYEELRAEGQKLRMEWALRELLKKLKGE